MNVLPTKYSSALVEQSLLLCFSITLPTETCAGAKLDPRTASCPWRRRLLLATVGIDVTGNSVAVARSEEKGVGLDMQSAKVLERPASPESVGRTDHVSAFATGLTEATILLVDGRSLMRECLARALGAEWPAARIVTAGWHDLARSADAASADICVASLDGAGLGALDEMAETIGEIPLVVLCDDGAYASVLAVADRGARGYFSTSVDLRVLVQGIRLVLVGGTAMPVPVAAPAAKAPARSPAPRSVSRFTAELFTPKELEVLGSLASGRPNKLIAHELLICETTVKVHLRHIFRKLGTTNRTHAALLAREMLDGAAALADRC